MYLLFYIVLSGLSFTLSCEIKKIMEFTLVFFYISTEVRYARQKLLLQTINRFIETMRITVTLGFYQTVRIKP